MAILLIASFCPAHAQRVNSVDGSISVSGGLDFYPVNTGTSIESSSSDGFYSISPAATLTSRTRRSSLSLSYAFGWSHFASDTPRNQTSHSFSLGVSRQLSPRWNMRIGDYYTQSSDIQTFYALRGLPIDEETIVLYFYPVTTNSSVGSNRLSAGADYSLSSTSHLSFSVDHGVALYGNVDGAPLVGLSDLQTISFGASYTRQLSERTSLSIGYGGSYFTFDGYRSNSAIATSVTAGISSVVAKDMTLSISAGPSRVNNLNLPGSNTNITASVSLSKRIEKNSFYFSMGNNNATTSGVGGVSSTRSLSAGVSRSFNRRLSVFGDFTAYDGSGILGNPFRTQGTTATANVGVGLTKNLSMQGGVQFQRFTHPSPYAFTQKRLFASLSYSYPNLLRSH